MFVLVAEKIGLGPVLRNGLGERAGEKKSDSARPLNQFDGDNWECLAGSRRRFFGFYHFLRDSKSRKRCEYDFVVALIVQGGVDYWFRVDFFEQNFVKFQT